MGSRTGDPPCLDLDLQLRDAPAPAAPRWRKTHRGLGSAPLTVQSLCLTREKWRRQARCPCRKTGFAGRINPSFRREELRRERATEPEPAPLLLERLFQAPVAAAPKE